MYLEALKQQVDIAIHEAEKENNYPSFDDVLKHLQIDEEYSWLIDSCGYW